MLPSGRMVFAVLASALIGAFVAVGIDRTVSCTPPTATGLPGADSFVAVGRTYLPQLGRAYAGAWEDGAKTLDSGQSVHASLDVVARSWSSNRGALFDRSLAPLFASIVPESTADADVTPAQRAAMAAAWRGLARGLSP